MAMTLRSFRLKTMTAQSCQTVLAGGLNEADAVAAAVVALAIHIRFV